MTEMGCFINITKTFGKVGFCVVIPRQKFHGHAVKFTKTLDFARLDEALDYQHSPARPPLECLVPDE